MNFSSRQNPVWEKKTLSVPFSYLCEFHCGNYALKPPSPLWVCGEWLVLVQTPSSAQLSSAASEKIPNTKEVVSLCLHCNEHHASAQLPAAGDSPELQILFQLNFPADFPAPERWTVSFWSVHHLGLLVTRGARRQNSCRHHIPFDQERCEHKEHHTSAT